MRITGVNIVSGLGWDRPYGYGDDSAVITSEVATDKARTNELLALDGRAKELLGKMRIWPQRYHEDVFVFDDLAAGTGDDGRSMAFITNLVLPPGDYTFDTATLKLGIAEFDNSVISWHASGNTLTNIAPVVDSGVVRDLELKTGVWSDWFRVPGDSNSELFVDLRFPSGVYSPASNAIQTDVDIEYRPAGGGTIVTDNVIRSFSVGAQSQEARLFGQRYPVAAGAWEVRARRVSAVVSGDRSTMLLAGVRASYVAIISGTSLPVGRLTASKTVPVTWRDNRLGFNVELYRKLAVLAANGTPGAVGTTSRVADILYFLCTDPQYGARSHDDVDAQALADIQADIEATQPDYGFLNLILSGAATVAETIDTVAATVRIQVIRQGRRFEFRRDTERVPVNLLTARVKGAPESRNNILAVPDASDAVTVNYRDAALAWNDQQYTFPEIAPVNPIVVDAVGYTWARSSKRVARYVWDEYQNRQHRVTVSMTEDGASLRPYDVLWMVDAHKRATVDYQGEVINIIDNGATKRLIFDRPIGSAGARIIVRNSEGTAVFTQDTTIAAGYADVTGFSFELPTNGQMGLAFAVDRLSGWPVPEFQNYVTRWQVLSVTPTDLGLVQLVLRPYDESNYSADTVVIP